MYDRKAKDFEEKSYLRNINPTIKKTLNREQKTEIRNVLKRLLPPAFGKEILDVRFTFWFFKRWYFVLIFGIDQRRNIQITPDQKGNRAIVMVFRLIIYFIIGIGMIVTFVILLYTLKSLSGVDILPAEHVTEFIRRLI